MDHPPALDLLKQAIQICAALSRPIQVGSDKVPGWYLPRHPQFTEQDRIEYPKGNFNPGMAHGVTSLMAFLSVALLAGIGEKGHKEAIKTIADWMEFSAKTLNNRVFWPSRISFEEQALEASTTTAASSDAWCYGTAGVARALYLAGEALGDRSMQSRGSKAFLDRVTHLEILALRRSLPLSAMESPVC